MGEARRRKLQGTLPRQHKSNKAHIKPQIRPNDILGVDESSIFVLMTALMMSARRKRRLAMEVMNDD
jgi:hypothetical protein